eukprot:jgi/Mesen1/5548/ME000280S04676
MLFTKFRPAAVALTGSRSRGWTSAVNDTLRRGLVTLPRNTMAQTIKDVGAIEAAVEQEVLVEQRSGTRTAVLNRPKALNALNTSMVVQLRKLYGEWESSPNVHIIVLKGKGRAFCAGGDVRAIQQLGAAGQVAPGVEFFRREYELNYKLATLKKPHVALMDGVVMGGGNGVSQHGLLRVATENTVGSETLVTKS